MSIANEAPTAADFGRFFRELWGDEYKPYDWQQRLAEQVMSSDGNAWPEVIALPTAAGKTACLDIAVFALAALADTQRGASPHPRRLFYTVDRRNIVDQTYDRAKQLAGKLAAADAGIVKVIADRLRILAGDDARQPLAVHRLRGGIRGASGWERNPRQPAIITTTVDQIGSSLLFNAYGKGRRTWPVYAGLAANDSIIILDEAHCAQPFLQTLRAVAQYRQWAETPQRAPFQVVIMSATPPDGVVQSGIFRDTSSQPADRDHQLGRRQLASKPAALAVAKRVPRGGNALTALGQELAGAALELAGRDIRSLGTPTEGNAPRQIQLELAGRDTRSVVVFANRVATAREAYRIIREGDAADAVLVTGRMRQKERDAALDAILQRAGPERRSKSAGERPLIVVATQTLEIGADLDFDGLVSECASLDALQQRFGRLNRTGRDIPALARIIIPASQVSAKTPDPIYGDAISATWQWLNEQADASGGVDFGIASIDAMLASAPESEKALLTAPAKDATVMLPAHLDAWAQTGPEPRTGPTPALDTYLHGVSTAPADVQVCWRAGLDLTDRDQVREILQLCPPSSMELAPAPLSAFRKWLTASSDVDNDDTGDAPGETTAGTEPQEVADDSRHRLRDIVAIRPNDDQPLITANPRDIRPGDTVVIPIEHSGNPHAIVDMLPDDVALLDIGDEAMRDARGKPTLRLVMGQLADADPKVGERFQELMESELDSATRQSLIRELLDLLVRPEVCGIPEPVKRSADALREISGDLRLTCPSDRQLIIQSRRTQSVAAADIEQPDDADDVTHSKRARPIGLADHSCGVRDWAVAYAQGCGIAGPELEAIRGAALLHDIGKADPLFQRAMHHGSRYYTEPLAKSPYAVRPGVRHELMSVRMAESNPALLPDEAGARDLMLHLIASHHGYCRPFAPFRPADLEPRAAEFELDGALLRGAGPTGLERLDSGVAERYWRLTRKYGWWGLAYLEAILRVADWSRSQWEETYDDE